MPVAADVMDMDQLTEAARLILGKWGKIDILVNAAGGNIPGATIPVDQTVFNMNIEDYRKVVDLNLNGTVFPYLVFGKSMAETGTGSIINLSSMATFSALSRVMGYSVAKSGIEIFTKWLAMELAMKFSEKVRVNCIAPGPIATEMPMSIPAGLLVLATLAVLAFIAVLLSRITSCDG